MPEQEKRKPNILHTECSDGWGGQEMRILLEAEEFQKRGYRVILVCYPESGLLRHAKEKGVEAVALPIRNSFDLRAMIGIYRLIKKEKIDIVNTHSSKDSWVASLVVRMANLPVVLIRTRHLSGAVPNHLLNVVYRMPDMIITTCESSRKEMIKKNGVSEDRIVSIPTGVPLNEYNGITFGKDELRKEIGVNDNTPIVCKVAVLRSWKRHDIFLRSAVRVIKKMPEVKFLIVGEGPQRANIEKRIKELGLEENVIMTGYRNDVSRIFALSDMSVLVSDSNEGVPQSVVQSLAMKKTVVGTNVGGIPELVLDGKTGILIEPNNPDILAEKILLLLKDKDYAKQLGEAGRRLIEEKFSREKMIGQLESLYTGLLNNRKSS